MTDIHTDPTIEHIYAKIAELREQINQWDEHVKTTISLDWVDQVQSVQQNQEQRLRALERIHTNPQGTTYTPIKISHIFQIDLLNEFLNISYPAVLGSIGANRQELEKVWKKVEKELGELMSGDIYLFVRQEGTIRIGCTCCRGVPLAVTSNFPFNHSNALGIINNFLSVTFGVLFEFRGRHFSRDEWDDYLDNLNDLLVSGDVGIKVSSGIMVSNYRFVIYCDCSECEEVVDSNDPADYVEVDYIECACDSDKLCPDPNHHNFDFGGNNYNGDDVFRVSKFCNDCGAYHMLGLRLSWYSSENETTNVDTAIYSCTGCFDTFDTESELKEHEPECIKSEQDKISGVASSKTSISDILDIHKKLIHPTFIKYSSSYICKACHKQFDSEEFLYDHHKSEHTVVSTADLGNEIRGMSSDKPTVVINDDPVKYTKCIRIKAFYEESDGRLQYSSGSDYTISSWDELLEYLSPKDDDYDGDFGYRDHHNEMVYSLELSDVADGPVGIKNSPVANKAISIEFSNLDCGICKNEVVSPNNFCILDNQLFHFDCVIEARKVSGGNMAGGKIADKMETVHLLTKGIDYNTYCGFSTKNEGYFTNNIMQELASYQQWCVDCLLLKAKINELREEI